MDIQSSNAGAVRRWSLWLVMALAVDLACWTLAGAPQPAGAGLDGFGLLQWKAS
jgi:hypothetical protein